MKFEFRAKIVFEAKDIDDAFKQLAEHFTKRVYKDEPEAWYVGTMQINSIEDKT